MVGTCFQPHSTPRIEFTDEQLQAPKRIWRPYRPWNVNIHNNVFCHDCGNTKARIEFNVKLSNGCKDCKKGSTIMRNQPQRKETWTLLQNSKTWQNNSGVPMTSAIGHYKLSIERPDVMITYTKENIVLCCQEFNSADFTRVKTKDSNTGCSGWSREKYAEVLSAKMNLE